ncbi:MAG: CoA-binding protein, partial [Bacteroidetes bacterium]|nr:CoA-binding protein [Bacteroidota bacterium]
MINDKLFEPRSIVVVGGSNDRHKPGGAVLQHLIEKGYRGKLYVVNPKE